MAKYNSTKTVETTVNRAGGEAYKQSPKLELVSLLLTSFVADQYYEKESNISTRVKSLLDSVEPEFSAKAAVYARTEFGMRSISHMVAAELADKVSGKKFAKSFYDKVINRPDDMTEILSYYFANKGSSVAHAIRDGFARAIGRFDKYQLAKYRGEGKNVSLVDVVNLVRPVPTEKNGDALQLLVEGKLVNDKTWESKLSKAGQKAETEEEKEKLKAAAWTELIKEGTIGQFALLRNLRNILETAPTLVDNAVALLTDEKRIKKSLILPFRYYTAYAELQSLNLPGVKKVLKGLSDALDKSIQNVPKFEGETLVVVDHSGSMDSATGKSSITNFHTGALFGVALAKSNDADLMYFGDTAKYYNVRLEDSTIGQIQVLDQLNGGYGWGYRESYSGTEVGHGTNFHSIFEEANKKYDRIIIFSDMQAWMGYHTPKSAVSEYKKRTGANPFIYCFDLSGYGDMQFPENQVFEIAGFSEKTLDVMQLLEQDRNALVKKIEAVTL